MPRAKNYKSAVVPTVAKDRRGRAQRKGPAAFSFKEVLGEDVRLVGYRGVDLEEWIGKGIDEWVWACLDAFEHLLRAGRQTTTVNGYYLATKRFFQFITEGRSKPLVARPADLAPLHVTQFIAWLQRDEVNRQQSTETTRNYYKSTKATLVALMDIGEIDADPSRFFPGVPLPHKNNSGPRFEPYSAAEQQRIADALKADLIDLHHGRLRLIGSEVMTTYFLIVAMRSGCNTTPLLELERDGLKPGLLPGSSFLRLAKHRGGKVVQSMIATSTRRRDIPTRIPADAVAVLTKALDETREMAKLAPPQLRNRVWLFRSMARRQIGEIKCLSSETLVTTIRNLTNRRDLRDDQGRPMNISPQRLRESLGKRAWRLSNGDPLAVAAVLSNTPQVADSHYLRIDEQLLRDGAMYIEKELGSQLRGARKTIKVVAASAESNDTATPAGRCLDSLHGSLAPKDGTHHCDQFVLCLTCPSFAIAGELADLWRLFSFQRFAIDELDYLKSGRASLDGRIHGLVALYEVAIPFIDRFCDKSFPGRIVAMARRKMESGLHPFWAQQLARAKRRREANLSDEHWTAK